MNMKFALIFVVFTLFAFAATENANAIKKPGELNMTAKIQKKLKEIIDKLTEPIVLSEKNIKLNTENVQLDATFNGSISGITNLTVNDFEVSLLGRISVSSFEFVLPILIVDITSYDLDGKLGLTHIFGKGTFFLNLENIVLKGSAKLGVESSNVKITSIIADLSLDRETFNFKITGWLDDDIRSEFMSNLINNIVYNMTPEFKSFTDKAVSSILTQLAADFSIPLKDLINP